MAWGWVNLSYAASEAGAIDPAIAEKNRKANEACFACHSEFGLKNPPRTDMDMKKLAATLLEPPVFGGSNHGTMDCRQCHGQGYNDFPHSATARNETSPCSECHATKVARLEPQFDASVHAKNEGLKEKFTCGTCHDPHIDLGATRLKDPHKIVSQDNKGCLNCHNSDEKFGKFAPENEKTPGLKKKRPDIDTIHEWLPNTKAHWNAVRCVECHTPEVKANKMLSHEILDKEKAEKKCLSCHSADSSLKTRLYRHMVKDEQQRLGFTNSVILSNSYVIGATRNPLLDNIVIGLVMLTLLGLLGHGAIRIIMAMRRKGQK
jgi:cytochrome c551/c552